MKIILWYEEFKDAIKIRLAAENGFKLKIYFDDAIKANLRYRELLMDMTAKDSIKGRLDL